MAWMRRFVFASAVAAAIADSSSAPTDGEILNTLAEDDVCNAGDEECSLELRQLRANEKLAEANQHVHADVAAGEADSKVDASGVPAWCQYVPSAYQNAACRGSNGGGCTCKSFCADSGEPAEAQQNNPECCGCGANGAKGGKSLAQEDSTVVSEAKQEQASFGDNVEGQNMWTETTWGDVLMQMQVELNGTGIPEGNCGTTDTYGTCSVFNCAESRGATVCSGGKCLCESGFCAHSGFCYPKASQCLDDTGGSCAVLGCKSSRGSTKCKSGKCLCKTGGCAWKGKCYPVTDTGGTCSIASCKSSRGPTTCHRGRCICQAGYVAVKGECIPNN